MIPVDWILAIVIGVVTLLVGGPLLICRAADVLMDGE